MSASVSASQQRAATMAESLRRWPLGRSDVGRAELAVMMAERERDAFAAFQRPLPSLEAMKQGITYLPVKPARPDYIGGVGYAYRIDSIYLQVNPEPSPGPEVAIAAWMRHMDRVAEKWIEAHSGADLAAAKFEIYPLTFLAPQLVGPRLEVPGVYTWNEPSCSVGVAKCAGCRDTFARLLWSRYDRRKNLPEWLR